MYASNFFEGRPLLSLHNTKGAVTPVVLSLFATLMAIVNTRRCYPQIPQKFQWIGQRHGNINYVPSWPWQIRNSFMPTFNPIYLTYEMEIFQDVFLHIELLQRPWRPVYMQFCRCTNLYEQNTRTYNGPLQEGCHMLCIDEKQILKVDNQNNECRYQINVSANLC